jgi:hypothetical protein
MERSLLEPSRTHRSKEDKRAGGKKKLFARCPFRSAFMPANSPRLRARIRANVTAMSKEHENSEELIIIYCHQFDAVSGFYAQSAPIGVCTENELHGALEAINAGTYYENYLLETVPFTELSPEDKLEIIEQFSKPEILLRQIIPGAYNLGDELPIYG